MTGMRRTVTAFFDNRAAAERAVESLVQAGFPRTSVHLVAGSETGSLSQSSPAEHEGFWEALKDFFLPEEDRYTYAEGLRRGGYLVTVTTSDANYNRATEILDVDGTIDIDERARSWRKEGWKGYTAGAMSSAQTAATNRGARENAIPVVQEELKIGKREVTGGRVRVRSYVIETPVTEQVNLRDEHVTIERRPTDRPLTGADAAFRERTIEAEETRQEAVVSKEARVKEEVVLKKDVREHAKTVTDTVRRTDVKVEDDRGTSRSTRPSPDLNRRT